MKSWLALLFTLLLFVATLLVSAMVGINLIWIMILATALWAAIDSSKLQLTRYKSGISYHPGVLFIGISMLWIVGFPWYLIMRNRIKSGTAVLKEEIASDVA